MAYGTAHQALVERAQIAAGDVFLVRGAAGGVGLAAVELGRALGVKVIAAAGTADKIAVTEEARAQHFINTSSEDIREHVLDITKGYGADVIFDPGGASFKQACLGCIARKGRILIVGFADGEIPDIPAHNILNKYGSIVGVAWGRSYLKHEPAKFVKTLADVVKLCAAGRTKPGVERAVRPEKAVPVLADIALRKTSGRSVIVSWKRRLECKCGNFYSIAITVIQECFQSSFALVTMRLDLKIPSLSLNYRTRLWGAATVSNWQL